MQGYGMTEASPVTNVNPLSSPREGTVGPPVADTHRESREPRHGRSAAAGRDRRAARLRAAGDAGLLEQRPDATAETITPDGWLRTGDIVSADRRRLRPHPRPQEGDDQVQGLPGRAGGTRVGAHGASRRRATPPSSRRPTWRPARCRRRSSCRATPTSISSAVLAFVAEKVAPYKKIRDIEIVDAIPKNPSGKILRRQLIEEERAERSAPVSTGNKARSSEGAWRCLKTY